MTPRVFCNVVYARLAAACLDAKERERLDQEVYAPAIGWEQADRNLWKAVMSAPDPEG
ncbi:MAG TPA: hypothetical protein VIV12_11805 [Streptosporangiaceae bacterium]